MHTVRTVDDQNVEIKLERVRLFKIFLITILAENEIRADQNQGIAQGSIFNQLAFGLRNMKL
jgi:hypothetical protein